MNSKEIVEEFVERMGWSDMTVVILLCRFIDDYGSGPHDAQALRDYLEAQAVREEQPDAL